MSMHTCIHTSHFPIRQNVCATSAAPIKCMLARNKPKRDKHKNGPITAQVDTGQSRCDYAKAEWHSW